MEGRGEVATLGCWVSAASMGRGRGGEAGFAEGVCDGVALEEAVRIHPAILHSWVFDSVDLRNVE